MKYDQNPTTDDSHCVPIVRPRLRHPISFSVANHDFRGLYTHWFGGSTIGCSSPATCEACEHNVKRVWIGHMLAYTLEDDRLVLISFTSPSVKIIRRYTRERNGIFGLKLRMVRMGGRETGPVGVSFLGHDDDRDRVTMSALEKILLRLYADNANRREVRLG